MVSSPVLALYLISVGVFLLLQVVLYLRNRERADRVKTLWLAPIVVLPLAIYFCLFAGVALTSWVLIAAGASLVVGVVLELIHIRSAQIIPDMQRHTLRMEGSARPVLLLQMLLDAVCYATLLMLILSAFHLLAGSFFRQLSPELVLFSFGSRVVHALLLSRFWKNTRLHDPSTAAMPGSRLASDTRK